IRVAAVATGGRAPQHWSGSAASWDRWDLKALLGELQTLISGHRNAEISCTTPRSALLERASAYVGDPPHAEGGVVRPDALDAPPWAEAVWAVEALLPDRLAQRTVHYRPLPE